MFGSIATAMEQLVVMAAVEVTRAVTRKVEEVFE